MLRTDTLKLAVTIAGAVLLVLAFSAIMMSPAATKMDEGLCEARAEAKAQRVAEGRPPEGGPIGRAIGAPGRAIARVLGLEEPC